MTQQPAIKRLTCDCCSVHRMAQQKQPSGRLRFLWLRNHRIGQLAPHSDWRGYAWERNRRHSRYFATSGRPALNLPVRSRFALPYLLSPATKKARVATLAILEQNTSCRKNAPLSLRCCTIDGTSRGNPESHAHVLMKHCCRARHARRRCVRQALRFREEIDLGSGRPSVPCNRIHSTTASLLLSLATQFCLAWDGRS